MGNLANFFLYLLSYSIIQNNTYTVTNTATIAIVMSNCTNKIE